MQPLDAAHDFLIQLRKMGIAEQFSALPLAHQREYYEWVNHAPKATERLARFEKLRAKLLAA